LEALLGGLVARVQVGVVFAGELPISFADLLGAGLARYTERFVVVVLGSRHRFLTCALAPPPLRPLSSERKGRRDAQHPLYFLLLLLIVEVDEFGVDHVILAFVFGLGLAVGGRLLRTSAGRRRALVHGFGQLVAGGGEAIDGRVDLIGIVLVEDFLSLFERGVDLFGFGFAHLGAVLLQRLFNVVYHGIGAIAGVDGVLLLAVVGGVGFGIPGHLFHLVLGEAARARDGDFLLVVGAAILGGHIEDAIGIDIEGDFDLRHAAGGRRDIAELEDAEQAVVVGHGALTLVDLDLYRRLVFAGCGEDLALAGRDGRVALDQLGEDAAHGFDAQRERGDVQQKDVLHLAAQHAALNGRTDGNHFVRVHTLVRLFVE